MTTSSDAVPTAAPASAGLRRATETFAFLLVPDFTMISFAPAVEALRIANRMAGASLYRWIVASKDGQPVRASNGIEVNVDMGMAEIGVMAPLPAIVVCSGLGGERYQDREVLAWLRRMDRLGAELGALCTGAYVLARAGLLDGVRCTLHWENLPGFREDFPDADVRSELFEIDGRRFTCSGGTASLDLMLHRIRSVHGERLATAVSEQCIVDRIRAPTDPQRQPVRRRLAVHHPKLVLAIELMEANIEEPIDQEALAARIGLSRRQLERLFRQHLRKTPAQHYLETRLDRARHLLQQTDQPVMAVACATGFVSASHFSTCFRQMYGHTPRQERLPAA
ncbi:MAG: GlxA family transcriptional regulator [Geminicoccaceae bacterium]